MRNIPSVGKSWRVRRTDWPSAIATLWVLGGVETAFAQTPPEPSANQVTVTGSTIRRIDLESVLPVVRISREEIERSGATTLEQLLWRLPVNVNAFTEANSVGETARAGLSSANLRGLGGGSTLVLLDGRRLANHAFDGEAVDLGMIPLAAIDRIEVLTDGASAIYGTDAIAGVINIILRRDFVGAQAFAGALTAQHGGGAQRQLGVDVGTGELARDGYNLLAALHHARQERLRATQRSFSRTALQPDIGLEGLHGSTFPANIIDRPGRRILNPALASGCTPPTTLPFRPFPFRTPACGADPALWTDLLPEVERSSALLRATLRADAAFDVYAEVLLSQSRIERLSSPMLVVPVGNAAGPPIYPAGGPYYPSAFAVANSLSGNLLIAWRADELGPRQTTVESTAQRYVVGTHGRLAGWDVDIAAVHSVNRQAETYGGSWLLLGKLIPALRTGLINPWGPSAPEGQALLASTVFSGTPQTADAATSLVSAVASGPLTMLPAGPLMLGVGGELRRERLDYDWDPAVLLNGFVFVDNAPQSKRGQRDVRALHAELAWPIARGLDAQLAVRHDEYSDIGTSTNPKLALRWRLQPDLLLRGAWGAGFRAQPLYALDAPPGVTRLVAGLPDPLRCPVTRAPEDCAVVVQAYAGGNPDLRPEQSRQFSAGLLWQAERELSLGLDLWRIRQRDAIVPLTGEFVLRNQARFGDRITRGAVDPARPDLPGPITGMNLSPTNVDHMLVSGVDASARWGVGAGGWGRWQAALQATYVRRHEMRFDGVPVLPLVGTAEFGAPTPRWRTSLSLDWTLGPWGATLSQLSSAGYVDQFVGPGGLPRRVGATTLWDLQLRLAAPGGWRWSLDIQNLFDRQPPASNQTRTAQLGYNPQLSNPLGRAIGLKARFDFR